MMEDSLTRDQKIDNPEYVPIDDWHREHFPGLKKEFEVTAGIYGVEEKDMYNCVRILMTMLRENIQTKKKVELK